MNALTSTKKKKIIASLVLLKKKHYFVFVFIGKLLYLNVFRNNDFEYL